MSTRIVDVGITYDVNDDVMTSMVTSSKTKRYGFDFYRGRIRNRLCWVEWSCDRWLPATYMARL